MIPSTAWSSGASSNTMFTALPPARAAAASRPRQSPTGCPCPPRWIRGTRSCRRGCHEIRVDADRGHGRVREVGLIWTHRLRAEGRRAVCENADSTACSSQIQTAGPGTCYPTTSCTLLSRARAVYCRLSEAKNGHPPCADTLPVLRWDVRAAHEGEHGTRAGAHSPGIPRRRVREQTHDEQVAAVRAPVRPVRSHPDNQSNVSELQITPFKQIVRRSRRSDISENR